MSQITIEPINTTMVTEYETKAVDLTKAVATLRIKDQPSYEDAASVLTSIKSMAKTIDEARKNITKPLDQAKAAVMDLFRPMSTRLDNSERHVKSLMVSYTTEQERICQEQEEKLRKQAEKEAEDERKRLKARAKKALENGKAEKAAELQQKAAEVQVIAPTIISSVEKVAGLSMKDNWKAKVIDEKLVPREYLTVNEQMLDKVAKATNGSLKIPGVEFFSEKVVASR